MNPEIDKEKLERAVLAGVSLRGADLEGANLIDAELEGANLQGTCLIWANLIVALIVDLEHIFLLVGLVSQELSKFSLRLREV